MVFRRVCQLFFLLQQILYQFPITILLVFHLSYRDFILRVILRYLCHFKASKEDFCWSVASDSNELSLRICNDLSIHYVKLLVLHLATYKYLFVMISFIHAITVSRVGTCVLRCGLPTAYATCRSPAPTV